MSVILFGMQIVVRTTAGDHELDLRREHPDAGVSDLIAALDPANRTSGAVLLVDGRIVGSDLDLDEAGIVHGSVLQLLDPAAARAYEAEQHGDPGRGRAPALPVLALVGGPVSGPSHVLSSGELVVGRNPRRSAIAVPDPTVSPEHAVLRCDQGEVSVEDLQSHNGTQAEGEAVEARRDITEGELLSFGATEAVVRLLEADDRPLGLDPTRMAAAGSLAFNRPPRAALPPEVEAVTVPDALAPAKNKAVFNVAMLIGPILMGVLMVQVMGSIRYALFAVMSPVMMLSNYVGSRRRNKKENLSSARQFKVDLATFRDDIAAARVAERRRREQVIPDLAELVRRAELPSTRLWQRRVGHQDYLQLRVGRGPVQWQAPMDQKRIEACAELAEAAEEEFVLPRCPVEVDLAAGGVVGVVGQRQGVMSMVRSLVAQAAVHHGPADLPMMVLTDRMQAPDWDWAKWLPHVRTGTGSGRLLSTDTETSTTMLDALLEAAEERARDRRTSIDIGGSKIASASTLIVVDDESLTVGRRSPARQVLRGKAGPVAGIVIASSADRLPAVCTTVIHVLDDLGDAEVHRPQEGERVADVVIAGMDDATARRCARALSRFEDPEVEVAGAGIPDMVKLLPLLDMIEISAEQVLSVWNDAGVDPAPAAPVGIGEDGIVEINMVKDGPHGLVGGTTGSGKSEFLRSLVAGMAARVSPQHLVFVLVDYKGGSAFDECAKLPHTVGMVTDLDDHLAERALKSLEAELHHRERELRAAGATDLPEYLKMGAPRGPMPRLLLVVDEFATMAAELPDFMGALVGIAQRGRSLGVHMILATQRPSGAVNANIKANTNMRIALRVQDAGDSQDVIDRPDAAKILRSNPGRAYFRLGPTDVIGVQTALSTASSARADVAPISLAPFRFGPQTSVAAPVASADDDAPTDLARLVGAANQAFLLSGQASPRRPWLEMMPEQVSLRQVMRQLDEGSEGVPIGLLDDPEHQVQAPVAWNPDEGHLFYSGMVGSGVTNAVLATAVAACLRSGQDQLHLYGLDYGGGALAALEALPHAGAVVAANEVERQHKLVRHLRAEVARRRDLSAADRAAEPRILLVVDDVGSFLADHEGMDGQELTEDFKRVVAEGASVGVTLVMGADRPNAIPMRMMGAVANRIMFKHADVNDFNHIGVRPKDLPSFVPGRAMHGPTSLVLQSAWLGEDPGAHVAELAAQMPVGDKRPASIGAMPAAVDTAAVAGLLELGKDILLPVGMDADGRAVLHRWYAGDHFMVAGQARSGVSTTLRMMARALRAANPNIVLVGVAEERSPLRLDVDTFDALGTAHELEHIIAAAQLETETQWVFVVDDVHRLDEDHGLDDLVKASRADKRIIVGGRTDDLATAYSHWTRPLRRAGQGLLLKPKLQTDGELLGTRLPRRCPVPMVAGRGFLVAAGEQMLVQVAGSDLSDEPG